METKRVEKKTKNVYEVHFIVSISVVIVDLLL
jgi:hypothetical protein